MRSIRRSLIGYFMLLLALAMAGVGLLVDRFARAAIKDREAAEEKGINEMYKTRRREAEEKFNSELMNETKALARELQPKLQLLLGPGQGRGGPKGPAGAKGGAKGPANAPRGGPPQRPEQAARGPDPQLHAPDSEVHEFRLRLAMLELGTAAAPWANLATTFVVEPPIQRARPGGIRIEEYRPLTPLWTAFDSPRILERIREALHNQFDSDEHPGFYQFTMIVNYPAHPGRIIASIRSPRLGGEMPFPSTLAEPRGEDVEYLHDDVKVAGVGRLRRVVRVGGRRPLLFFVQVPPPAGVVPVRMWPFRPQDLIVRFVVQHARPYAELDARLAQEQKDGDDQLARVHRETTEQLGQIREYLGLIGLGSFAALVFGGWLIVARGLAPLRKLSEAVSRVSEKDFRLPVERGELSVELQPILARLTHTLDSLRLAFAREKQAVGDISHELRTPIASLLATIDVSLRKPRSPDQYRTTLGDCRGIAEQLGHLVERIMMLATLDAGTVRTASVHLDGAMLLADCAAVIRPLAEAHGVEFSHRAAGTLELNTDPDKLREVLMNLLHNAVEYNRSGGSVELSARRDGPNIVFEVRDTGIGMAPEVRERIFDRFYRADASRHATCVHSGLGLAIVKEYVERLGGTIAVESTLNVGSTFRVALPAAPAPSDEPDDLPSPIGLARPAPRYRGEPAPTGS